MNAFTQPLQSIARSLPPAKPIKPSQQPPNTGYLGWSIESGKQAQASREKHSKLGKASI